MRWVRVCSLVVVVAVGCGESVRREGTPVECTRDLDCAEGQKCVARGLPRSTRAETSRDPGRDLATGGTGTCPISSCGTGCPDGQVCRSGAMPSCPMYTTCQSACTDPDALPCGLGTMCRSSGTCEPVRCDDSDYPGCPTGMTCDPTVEPGTGLLGGYSLFGTDQYPFTDYDRSPLLTGEQSAAAAARCVFLRCDEPGGFGCADGFLCDVVSASPTSSGCVGVPCGELGRCASDAFICEPTSAGRRPDLVDPHGCVEKNCEEGRPCVAGYRCDVTNPITVEGCAPIRCDEPGGACGEEQKCAPETEREILPSGFEYGPDTYGCVYKRCDIDDWPCPTGMVCDPSSPLGDVQGCADPSAPPDAGVGGTSGTAGTAGTSGVGGATADPDMPGVCR